MSTQDTAPASAATRVLAGACDELLAQPMPPGLRDELARIRAELGRPLRIAVVGRVKSGKSTLVNALLGQRVARVDAAECTRAVTSFRYGHQESVTVRGRDGRTWTRAFETDGYLPADLGAAPEDVDAVDVVLCNAALTATTVMDTPGLDSLTADAGQRTEELLGLDGASTRAIAAADALLFLVPQLTREDDARLRALTAALRRTVDSSGFSPATVLAVVSKVDTADGGSDDPWPAAHDLAARYREQLRGMVAGVVPVIGLLAEVADAALLTEAHADALETLSRLSDDERELLLLSVDLFTTVPDVGVDEDTRVALLDLLGLHGIRLCLDELARGGRGGHALSKHLRAASGVEALHDAVHHLFTAQADAIAAHRALVALDRASFAPGAPDVVRERVEEVREDPALQSLRERDLLSRWASGELPLPPELADDLRGLATGADPARRLGAPADEPAAALAQRALDGATRWLRFGNDPRTDPAGRRAAEVVRDSYIALWEHLDGLG